MIVFTGNRKQPQGYDEGYVTRSSYLLMVFFN